MMKASRILHAACTAAIILITLSLFSTCDMDSSFTELIQEKVETDLGTGDNTDDGTDDGTDDTGGGTDAVVTIAAIPGVTPPVRGETPVTTITETAQYTGTVSWSPADDPFAAETAYTATITLATKSGYTLTGVDADFFTVAGADFASNSLDSGVVRAVFPATSAEEAIDVMFQSAEQIGGSSGTADSTGLTLTFDVDPGPLTAENITVTGATKGSLTGTGTTRSLAISNLAVANGETVSVTVTSPTGYSISGSPRTAVVYKAFTAINISAIPGVTPPAAGETPVTTITETDQYTGTVSWFPDDDPFGYSKQYTATITLTAKSGYTFTGLAADFFTVAGADSVNNDANSGVVTAVFPATGATPPTTINIAAIPDVTPPAAGEMPVSAITETDQYTGTVSWFPADNPFDYSTEYQATITLTAKNGYTLTGVTANFFTVAGADTVSNATDSGVVTAVFPETEGEPVNFISAVQEGGISGTASSTGLTLTFDVDPMTLTASDITVTGATKGTLTGTGTTRSLSISDITVANGGTVSVTISNPSGYAITGSPKTAVVYRAAYRVTYHANGGAGAVPTDGTSYSSGDTVTVLGNTGDLAGSLIRDGIRQRFIGWNTNSAATTAQYQAYYTFTITGNTTLYAIYTSGTDVLRKVGPAGGWIFYDAGSTQSWGRYLEAWNANESGGYMWKTENTTSPGTSTLIGTGYNNTYVCMSGANHPAANVARNATHGGYNDWFLPSKDELNQMWNNLNDHDVAGPFGYYLWSSSEWDTAGGYAWDQLFDSDYQQEPNLKHNTYNVRAVRAF